VKLKREQKLLLILGAVALGGYLLLRWWENRQSGSNETGLGTNLNSLPSALVAGSTGPQSGLNYYAGATNVYFSEPVTQSTTTSTTGGSSGSWYSGINPGGLMKKSGIPATINPGGPMKAA
jgi:hypothetical protein